LNTIVVQETLTTVLTSLIVISVISDFAESLLEHDLRNCKSRRDVHRSSELTHSLGHTPELIVNGELNLSVGLLIDALAHIL